MTREKNNRPSLENLVEHLVESQGLELESLHPGGLDTTTELLELCHIGKNTTVLDVASGTGESVCYLAQTFDCPALGVDVTQSMIDTARKKATARHLKVAFQMADAHQLPFADNTFDIVMSECTTCLLDKECAIAEMVRVAKPGGYVGIHDVCWQEGTPEPIKQRLADIEGERPETLAGWQALFEQAGLTEVKTVDKSHLVPVWMTSMKNKLGFSGQLKIFLYVLKQWGLRGLREIRASEQIFHSPSVGYGIIVGRKA